MATVRLKHVHAFRDRHGRTRHYLRVPGQKAIPLPGEPGSPEFLAAYQAGLALAGPAAPPAPRGTRRATPGSLDALAVSFYASSDWAGLKATTQAAYRRIIERVRAEHGDKPVALLEAKHLRAIVAKGAGDAPAAANHRLRTLRALMRHAVDIGLRDDDPSRDLRRVRYRSDGIATWSEEDIAQYEARWPSGSRQRLALALLLYTGQRRSDVVRMGRQHLRRAGAAIMVRQLKTDAVLEIPLHQALAAELALVPEGQLTFLLTDYGRPFTAPGFYNAFIGWVRAAGLPAGRSPHGLRKACCRRLAEAGCTAHQIMAISGHATLAEVERYTRAVEQARMAETAMARIKPRT